MSNKKAEVIAGLQSLAIRQLDGAGAWTCPHCGEIFHSWLAIDMHKTNCDVGRQTEKRAVERHRDPLPSRLAKANERVERAIDDLVVDYIEAANILTAGYGLKEMGFDSLAEAAEASRAKIASLKRHLSAASFRRVDE
jgi:hypothetical protein